MEEHPELAVLLILVSLEERDPAPVVRGALLSALAHSYCSAVLTRHTDNVLGIRWSPDGTRLAKESEDATAHLREVEPRTAEHTVHDAGGSAVNALDSRDGTLAAAGEDGGVRVWERGVDRPVHLCGHNGTVRDAALSPGKVLLSGVIDRRALARDRERQNALLMLYPDVRIVRFTWADLKRPGYILALVSGEGRGGGESTLPPPKATGTG